MYEIQLMKDMSDDQKMVFQSHYQSEKKDATVAILLCLFLGGLGAHRFYMGQVGLGVLYALFVWTFIPSLVALVELFLLKGRVERYNQEKAQSVASMVKM